MTEKPIGTGCVLVMLGINALLMGLLALGFSSMQLFSREQELWYLYGSTALLIAGAILPAITLLFGALRRQWTITALIIWMIAAFIAWLVHIFFSGGGV